MEASWIQVLCRALMIAQLSIGLLVTLYWDIEGREARKPCGFTGVVSTLIVQALVALIWYGAGAFG